MSITIKSNQNNVAYTEAGKKKNNKNSKSIDARAMTMGGTIDEKVSAMRTLARKQAMRLVSIEIDLNF